MRWLAISVVLALAACATTTPLSARVGELVEVRGVLEGRAKQGYVLDVDGEPLFVEVDDDLAAHFGDTATVRGTLRRHDPGELPASCTPQARCAESPPHYFLTDATFDFER